MEVLLLLHETTTARRFRGRTSASCRIVGEFAPRMVVAEVAELAELRQDPGVRFIVDDSVPKEIYDELTAGERLFLDAWLRKRRSPEKKRPGDHLPWDAPGFVPPDPRPSAE